MSRRMWTVCVLALTTLAFAAAALTTVEEQKKIGGFDTCYKSVGEFVADYQPCAFGNNSLYPFCNTSLTFKERVQDLVPRISMTSAATLLNTHSTSSPSLQGKEFPWLPPYQWWNEDLHGIAGSPGINFKSGPSKNATDFPMPSLTAGSFNRTLFHAIGEAVGTEGRAMHNSKQAGLTFWDPNININIHPRWGRGQETPGEDPFLTSVYAMNIVRGTQDHKNGPDSLRISTVCKHFAGYDLDYWGGYQRLYNNAIITQYDFDHTFTPAFEACYHPEGGAASGMMCSYNAVNGVPSCANKPFITELAREQWGFDGYVTSDCGAVAVIAETHHYAPTKAQGAADAINAGTDIDCGCALQDNLAEALEKGHTTKSAVQKSLSHLFEVQMRVGLFDPPESSPYRHYNSSLVSSKAHQDLSLDAARQGIVLLHNENNTLPLKLDSSTSSSTGGGAKKPIKSVFITGPLANRSTFMKGNYYGTSPYLISALDAIKKEFEDTHDIKVNFMPVLHHVESKNITELPQACSLAGSSDLTLMFMGNDQTVAHEAMDRYTVSFVELQNLLIHDVSACALAAGKPAILVSFSGSSLDYTPALSSAGVKAILWAGFPGQSGGRAVVDILVGKVNPSGRLTMTQYPAEFVNQVAETNMQMSANISTGSPGHTYRYYTGSPVFSFGHGLSYTTFSASPPSISLKFGGSAKKATVAINSKRQKKSREDKRLLLSTPLFLSSIGTASTTVTNTGSVAGAFSALLFMNSTSPHAQEISPSLADFQRVFLQPGESQQVTFDLNAHAIARLVRDDALSDSTAAQLANFKPGGMNVISPGIIGYEIDVAGSKTSGTFKLVE